MSLSYCFFILGPTAVGKSKLAHRAALALRGEIVNCDSLQLYKRLDIGTAKPSLAEMGEVPHHLFNMVELGGHFTAGDYRRVALELFNRRPLVNLFFVGGSGFYFQALEKGMHKVPEVPESIRKDLKDLVESKGLDFLYRELKERDPEEAEKIKSQDAYRVMRALGILKAGSKTLTEIRREFDESKEALPVPVVKVGLHMDKSLLRERVTQRARLMLERGLLEETRNLMHQGYGAWSPLRSVGYKECQSFLLQGKSVALKREREELLESIVRSTMQLAKRQLTWFRRDPEIRWYEGGEDEDWVEPLSWLEEFISKGE